MFPARSKNHRVGIKADTIMLFDAMLSKLPPTSLRADHWVSLKLSLLLLALKLAYAGTIFYNAGPVLRAIFRIYLPRIIMTMSDNRSESELISAFKIVLRENCHSSQGQLAQALAKQGFTNVSQSKISRMLSKLGAVKTRNSKNEVVYYLSDELIIPRSRQSIQSVVQSVKHNKVQIILKTGIGGAPLIARILDIMGESAGILGTIAGDDTIFIAPTDIERIDEISQSIIQSLELQGMG